MPGIAGTVFGQNTLMAGLICHYAAIVCAMIPDFGGDFFFRIVYPVSCLMFVTGTYAEIKVAGYSPSTGWRWYGAAAAAVLPVMGPLIVLSIIYCLRTGRKLSGLFPAILRMRAGLVMISILLLLLFLLFACLNMQRDPYFKPRAPETISTRGLS